MIIGWHLIASMLTKLNLPDSGVAGCHPATSAIRAMFTRGAFKSSLIDSFCSLIDVLPVKLLRKCLQLKLVLPLSEQNKYFNDPGVHALQYLDTIQSKDSQHRNTFYQSLTGLMHMVPKVSVVNFLCWDFQLENFGNTFLGLFALFGCSTWP